MNFVLICNMKGFEHMDKNFKIDTHIHTAESSECGVLSAQEIVTRYHAAGYDGIAITDHLHDEYILSLDCKDDWNACVDRFLRGYKNAKKFGDEIGLEVILGAEIRFAINSSDYLIYGFDEEFLRRNPYLYRLTPWEFFKKFGDEIIIIQAHPFRNGNETVFLECIHGIEVFNGNPRHNNRNEKALAFYKSNPTLYPFCGSDTHQDKDECRTHVLFKNHISSSRMFCTEVRKNNYSLCSFEINVK